MFTDLLKPFVDHCHNTNATRGVLCPWCNAAERDIKLMSISDVQIMLRLLRSAKDKKTSTVYRLIQRRMSFELFEQKAR
jgi:Recombination endonuclease VII